MRDHRHWYLPHFSSPKHCLNNVKASHHPLRFLFLFSSLCMGDARAPLTHFSLRPTHRCPRAEEREGEGERGEGQTKSFRHCKETHTSLCFHLSAWWTIILSTWLREKRTHSFLYYSLSCDGINYSHKNPQMWFCLLLFIPEVSVVLKGIFH